MLHYFNLRRKKRSIWKHLKHIKSLMVSPSCRRSSITFSQTIQKNWKKCEKRACLADILYWKVFFAWLWNNRFSLFRQWLKYLWCHSIFTFHFSMYVRCLSFMAKARLFFHIFHQNYSRVESAWKIRRWIVSGTTITWWVGGFYLFTCILVL